MFNRAELKAKGKAAFQANYWKSVVVSAILTFLTAGTTSVSVRSTSNSANNAAGTENVNELVEQIKNDPKLAAALAAVIFGTIFVVFLISTAVNAFVTNPLKMGCRSFFLKNSDDPNTEVGEIKKGFTPVYMRNVKALFISSLLAGLGAILFVVPGIIIALGYAMVPYILAEDKDITAGDALKKSKAMMKGHRWELFVFDLSFILWDLLTIVTLGLAGVFFVGPYEKASHAEYYKFLKQLNA